MYIFLHFTNVINVITYVGRPLYFFTFKFSISYNSFIQTYSIQSNTYCIRLITQTFEIWRNAYSLCIEIISYIQRQCLYHLCRPIYIIFASNMYVFFHFQNVIKYVYFFFHFHFPFFIIITQTFCRAMPKVSVLKSSY